jgi:hypothetical protein
VPARNGLDDTVEHRRRPRPDHRRGQRRSGARDRIRLAGRDAHRPPVRLPTTRRPLPSVRSPPNAHVATEPVEPLGPAEPVGNLFDLHEQAGIQLRVLADLGPFWQAVLTSSLGFSGIRLRNARSAS